MTIQLVVVTPGGPVFSGAVEGVVLPGVEGEFGVLERHERFLSALGHGCMEIRTSAGVQRSAVSSAWRSIQLTLPSGPRSARSRMPSAMAAASAVKLVASKGGSSIDADEGSREDHRRSATTTLAPALGRADLDPARRQLAAVGRGAVDAEGLR